MQHQESYVEGQLSKEIFLIKKREISTKEEDLKIRLSVAEHKQKEQAEKIKASATQMETSRKIIEWNFCDEIGEVIPFHNNLAWKKKHMKSQKCCA